MRGITEKQLHELFDHDFLKDCTSEYLMDCVLSRCKELNPWMPIDDNTPKDRYIIFYYPENKDVAKAI